LPKRNKQQTLIVISWESRKTGLKDKTNVGSEDYDLRYGLDTPEAKFLEVIGTKS
jgi:hypothetical protein